MVEALRDVHRYRDRSLIAKAERPSNHSRLAKRIIDLNNLRQETVFRSDATLHTLARCADGVYKVVQRCRSTSECRSTLFWFAS
jgi:hypothetical protein